MTRNGRAALLAGFMTASCGAPPWIPYRAECRCACAAEPCGTLTITCCAEPSREEHYRRVFGKLCAEFASAHSYFECALIASESENDAGDTVSHPIDYVCEQPEEVYAWEL